MQIVSSPLVKRVVSGALDAQVVSVFLGSFIAGSLFTQFEQWIKNPESAVTILGTAAPLTSIFFLNYVELNVSGCSRILHGCPCHPCDVQDT